jgi:hypothetical protein
MKYRSLALAAVAVGALGLAGCGGSDGGSSTAGAGDADPNTLLVSTFKPKDEAGKIKSGTIELKVDGKLSGGKSMSGKASAKISLNEGKDGNIPEFQADVAVNGQEDGGAKIDFKAGAVYTNERFYVSYDGENYDVGETLSERAAQSIEKSIKQSGSKSTAGNDVIGQLGLEPQTWLTDPKVEGTESIGGVEAYKISGAVNIKTLVPDVLEAAQKAQQLAPSAGAQKVPTVTDAQLDQVAKDIKKLDVEIWTGKDDNILRQIKVDVDIEGKNKSALEGALTLTLTNVNEEQDIKAPSDTNPITDLMPKLGGLFGAAAGLAGSAGVSGAGATSTPVPGAAATPSSAASQAYVKCVNDAGSDAAKLNACQAALTK